MRPLQHCLLDVNLVRLEVIAHFWEVELTSSRQRDVVPQLAEAMARSEVVAKAWEALPDEHRRALEMLLAAGGRMPLRVFVREWGEIRPMGPGRLQREQPWRDPISPTEGLWYAGFVYRAFDQEAAETYEAIFVPPELRAHLPVPSVPLPIIVLDPAAKPGVVRSAGHTLLDDACTLLAYLQNEQVRPSSDGDWPARHEARLARQLHDSSPARRTFLHHVTRRLGWLRSAAGRLKTDADLLRPDPGPVTTWLQSPAHQQRSTLAETWRDDPTWNDLHHVSTLYAEDTGAWRNDPLLARRAIHRHFTACEPETWYGLDDFVAAVRAADPDFQRPGGDYTTWYIRDAASGAYLSGFESWDSVEGALIRFLVTGPLAWLGLIDLGVTVPDGLSFAFRLTPAGLAFLGLGEPPPEPESPGLALRPGFTVHVPPARRYERFQLARVADWVRTGDPFIYRLTPASLDRARRQGISVVRILAFLDRVTGTNIPVPRFIEAALTRWDARGAEAWLEQGLLLRLSSEELMTQLMSHPRTRRLVRERVGPAAALVHEFDWPRLIAALGELGLLVDVLGLEQEDTG